MLKSAQRIDAEWLQYNREATRITFLSGPDAGKHLNDAGPFYSWLYLMFGLFMLHLAFKARRGNPRGLDPDTPALSGVDQASLLHLNRD